MKKYIIISVALTVLVLAAGLYLFNNENRQSSNSEDAFIEYKDPQLTEAQKKPFLDAVAQNQKELSELAKDSKVEDKYQKYLALASNYYPLGEFKKSRDAYLDAASTLPQYPIAWYGASTVDVAMGDYDGAIEHLDKAIDLDPANTEYWRMKLSLVKDMKNLTDTEMGQLYADALKATNNSADIISVYAKYLSDKDDLLGSAAQWKQAIEKNPDGRAIYEAEIKKLQDRLK